MTEPQRRVLDAIITEFKQTRKAIRIHKFAKRVCLTHDEMFVICKALVKSGDLVYIPCTDKSAPKNELVAPAAKHLL